MEKQISENKENEFINEKFNQLLEKIDLQKKKREDPKNEENEADLSNENLYNKDKALKELYDQSVEFKNSLA